jgi:hypothetical protein
VQDPVDGALVFLDDAGRVLGRAGLPAGFSIGKVVPGTDQVRMIDESGHHQIVIARTIDPVTTDRLEASEVPGLRAAVEAPLSRSGLKRLTLGQGLRSGQRPLQLRSSFGGTLADAYDIGTDAQNNRYVVTEEIVSSKPSLKVRVSVQRFDRSGKLTGRASVPIDQMDVVPRGFATVTDAGVLRILVPKQNGVVIQELPFQNLGPRSSAPRRAAVARRQIPIDTNVIAPDGAGNFAIPSEPRSARPATPPISRSKIMSTARGYLTVNWVMGERNFSRQGIENACVPAQWKHWKRPNHFKSSMIGQTVGPMPYWWGGDDTPQSFLRRIADGALAGSVCTCRDARYNQCVVSQAAGVDCSGFVSRAWGIAKLGTGGLLDVATPVAGLNNLRPGDAFDWPGHHVRLLVGREPGAAIAFKVLESATRADCEGVCERTYRASEMNQYKLIRFRGTVDD